MTLVPDRLRRWAVLLLVLSAGVVAVLGVRYTGQHAAGRVDTAIDSRLAVRLEGHQLLLQRLIRLGEPTTVAVVSGGLALLMLLLRRWRAVLLAAVAPGLAGALTDYVLKPLIGRTIGGGLSFPSGHTTGAFSLALVAVLVLLTPGPPPLPPALRALIALVGLALAAGTATALVALSYHYATDAVGGVCTALGTVLAVALLIDAALRSSSAPQPGRRRTPAP